jgi:hypothetical protein
MIGSEMARERISDRVREADLDRRTPRRARRPVGIRMPALFRRHRTAAREVTSATT